VCNICSRCGAIMTIVHRSQISTLRPSRSSSAELGRVWTEDGIPLHRDPLDLFHEERCEEIRQYKLLLYRYRTELAKVNDQIHALVEGAVVPLSCEPTLTRLFGSEEAQGIQHALRGYSLLKVSLFPQSKWRHYLFSISLSRPLEGGKYQPPLSVACAPGAPLQWAVGRDYQAIG
jgi:hypothetical protein